jgi:hypothetical protein
LHCNVSTAALYANGLVGLCHLIDVRLPGAKRVFDAGADEKPVIGQCQGKVKKA